MKYTPALARLIDSLRCLPGVGPKSAQRMAFYLLERDRDGGSALAQSLAEALAAVGHCKRCRMLTESELCAICSSAQRDAAQLCVVESPADVVAIEQSGGFRGPLLRADGASVAARRYRARRSSAWTSSSDCWRTGRCARSFSPRIRRSRARPPRIIWEKSRCARASRHRASRTECRSAGSSSMSMAAPSRMRSRAAPAFPSDVQGASFSYRRSNRR